MHPTPDWISIFAPFASGAVGAGLTAGIAWGVMKQKLEDLERRVVVTETKLCDQVGEARCDKMREACRESILDGIKEIKVEIVSNRNWVTDRFTEIARFMGQHTGR